MAKTEQQPITHVLNIIDMSGSMSQLAADVRGGFNEYKAGLAADTEREYRLTVVLFDHEYMPLAVDKPLTEVPDLDSTNYVPRGNTALNDAIGRALAEFDATHGKVKKQERVLFVIQTDGYENSSREYSTAQVKDLIADKDKSDRWGFIYLGAGPAAWAAGNAYGLGATSMATQQSGAGTRSTYSGIATAAASYSRGSSIGETFSVLSDADGVADSNA